MKNQKKKKMKKLHIRTSHIGRFSEKASQHGNTALIFSAKGLLCPTHRTLMSPSMYIPGGHCHPQTDTSSFFTFL